MNGGHESRLQPGVTRRSGLLVGLVLLIAVIVFVNVWMAKDVNALGRLDECSFRWPVIEFEPDAWSTMPGDVQVFTGRQLPVLDWPAGYRYDEQADALLDGEGEVVFGRGDAVHVRGRIVDQSDGDIPPCFFVYGIRIEALSAP